MHSVTADEKRRTALEEGPKPQIALPSRIGRILFGSTAGIGQKLPRKAGDIPKPIRYQRLKSDASTFEPVVASGFFAGLLCGGWLFCVGVYMVQSAPPGVRKAIGALVPDVAIGSPLARPQFKLGSSKWEVAAIQGEPTKLTGNCWIYGTSKVCFQNDRVVSWHSSPDNPLNLTRR